MNAPDQKEAPTSIFSRVRGRGETIGMNALADLIEGPHEAGPVALPTGVWFRMNTREHAEVMVLQDSLAPLPHGDPDWEIAYHGTNLLALGKMYKSHHEHALQVGPAVTSSVQGIS